VTKHPVYRQIRFAGIRGTQNSPNPASFLKQRHGPLNIAGFSYKIKTSPAYSMHQTHVIKSPSGAVLLTERTNAASK